MAGIGKISLKMMSLVLAGMIVTSCEGSTSTGADNMMQSNIVAGPGEQSFSQKYDPQLVLPIPEEDFIKLLKKNGLDFSIAGVTGTERSVPPPRRSNDVDLSSVQKMYQVYGPVDRVRRIGEMYRAYVDTSHRVIYVENAYAYTGP